MRGEVAKVDVEDGSLRLNSGAEISWDRLVLATGSIGNSFGIPGVDEHAPADEGTSVRLGRSRTACWELTSASNKESSRRKISRLWLSAEGRRELK